MLKRGSPVVVMDLIGVGEIGQVRKGNYNLEGKETNENVAMMLYLLGRSMIEFQTREILSAIEAVSESFKDKVNLYVMDDNLVIPVRHAWTYEDSKHIYSLYHWQSKLIPFPSRRPPDSSGNPQQDYRLSWFWTQTRKGFNPQYVPSGENVPRSWREEIRSEPENRFGHFNSPDFKGDGKPHYLFSNTIHGALRYYDWTELSSSADATTSRFSEAAQEYLEMKKE
jgi:hypothetical protein